MNYDKNTIIFEALPTNPKFINRTGMAYGPRIVLGFAGIINTQTFWFTECECGTIQRVSNSNLIANWSCGCATKERMRKKQTIHGHYFHPLNGIFRGMHTRCENPKSSAYKYYGGRGITICQGWDDFLSFVEDVEPRPTESSLDRVNNDCGYWCGHCDECIDLEHPKNWRWATRIEQMNNSRQICPVTLYGRTQSRRAWARELGIKYNTVRARVAKGWSDTDALLVPLWQRPTLS